MARRTARGPVERECEGCGTVYTAKTARSRRCRKDCGRKDDRTGPRESKNAARAKRRAESGPFFVGIDGEGVTRLEWVADWDDDGNEITVKREVHYYDMLSVGDHTYVTPNGDQMHYEEALQHIWDSVAEYRAEGHEKICLVGFFLSYDFCQIFSTLPERAAWKLFSSDGQKERRALQAKNGWNRIPKVAVGKWRLDLLAGKRLTINHTDHKGVTVTICDAGSFFQTSFLSAIDPQSWDEPVCTAQEYATIVEGKQARGRVMTREEQMATRSATANYNVTENLVLARLMARLDEGFRHCGVQLRADQFYGPGQAAQTWMKNIGAPRTEDVAEALPTHIASIAQQTYYGGWFEIFVHGHVPGITNEYDITSAYPNIIKDLPCLLCGVWKPDHVGILRIAKYHVRGPWNAVTGPLPFRKRTGNILRPLEVRGYYWADEVEAADRAGLVEETITVEDRWSYHLGACEHRPTGKPFEEIADLFLERIKVGKDTPAGKAMKLVYNSAYGKTAQSVGMPQFANAVYASWITAGCRVKILNAIASHPTKAASLTMVATDAVFFRAPDPADTELCAAVERWERALPLSPKDSPVLGQWEKSEKRNLLQFMPGVYWDDKARQAVADGGSVKLKSRGISARQLSQSIGEIDAQFTAWDGITYARDADGEIHCRWPRLKLYSDFGIISPGQALGRRNWALAGMLETYEEDTYDPDTDTTFAMVRTGMVREMNASAAPKRWMGSHPNFPGTLDQDLNKIAIFRRNGVWRTRPYPVVTTKAGEEVIDTVPYDKSFGVEESSKELIVDHVTPDGPSIRNMVKLLQDGA